ncbi:DnaJ domain-containing protein [Desulfoferrobacter suflitae]|uniref:DnaJ domain-containing protein n=1 Tax=Desulfoferrobacter suflitae TaxID=2865782 RepID=UPI00216454D6|nr:DnaJ domain-containing protein [Desulfoferrobacter suflitae]MCK8600932.1 DnaJ domain-containing protein [Desulfoferrobacter suflitae]
MKRKDYYSILGVSRSATTSGIRAAFRRLAKEHHPDLAGTEKTRYFQEITEAYCVLSRPATREDYNRSLREEERQKSSQPPANRAPSERPAASGRRTPRDIGGDFTGMNDISDFFFREFFGVGTQHGRHRFLDLEVILTPEEAVKGGLLPIPISESCPRCGGRGQVAIFACAQCSGRGTIETGQSARLRIPPNIRDGTVLEVPAHPLQSRLLRVVIRVRNLN